jgi:hypothetical protein
MKDRFVGIVIVIVMLVPDIEKTVPSEAKGLVDLEIETDGSHMLCDLST